MGVTGLWRLIEPAGKPVPIETLENKVLAVDISIWLHQMVKGFQDAKGAPMPNAHLLGLFQRLCKLLYFRIKPVFVFDGGFPDLKKETIAKRQDNKAKLNSESERLKREILLLLGKKTAIGSLLGKQTSPKKTARMDATESEDLFKLPDIEQKESATSESESEDESYTPVVDLHSIDLESENFKNLPLREKHDVLIELKETRKMNSWGKLHELPKDSDNFSNFQMNRLLKRRKVQECLEETEKEIGGNSMTLNELESLLNEEGIKTDLDSLPTKRIAADDKTRYLLISNVKQALEEAKQKEIDKEKAATVVSTEKVLNPKNEEEIKIDKNSNEEDEELKKAIQMSLECTDDGSERQTSEKESMDSSSFMVDSDCSNTSEEEVTHYDFNVAKAFIMQNTDYTPNVITKIVSKGVTKTAEKPKNKVDEILKELESDSRDSGVIKENEKLYEKLKNESTLDLSSSDDDDLVEANKTDQLFNEKQCDISEKSIICLNSTVGEVESSLSKDEITFDSTQDTSDNDDDFVDVPESTSVHTLKPVVELNLEMKNTLEDDIFADVFQHLPENKQNEPIHDQENLDSNACKFMSEFTVEKMDNVRDNQSFINNDSEDSLLILPKIVNQSEDSLLIMPKIVENTTDNIKTYEEKAIKNPESSKKDVESVSDGNGENICEFYQGNLNSDENPATTPFSIERLNSLAEELQTEHEDLIQEKSRLERMGRNITEQMTRDAQELLQIFGIPYIVAPCEAEAQCAFLENAKLTDGTITDDSDIWLFGGKTVYKNFFNQKKLVMQFLSERINRSFNLSREQLILLALLVGSDYTTGVNGVGPVTAMEILASFSCSRKDLLLFQAASNPQAKYSALLSGLQEFKKWVRSGRRTDDNSLRKKLKNVEVTDDFPSIRVVQAYLEPKVETSEEKFTWGEPDLTILGDYARKKFGWSKNKLDEILNPVLKRMQDRKSQRTMQDYFQRTIEFQSLEDQMSKRVKAAVEKMGNEDDTELMKPPEKPLKKGKLRENRSKSKKDHKKNIIPDIKCLNEPSTSKSVHESIKVASVNDVTNCGFDIVVPKLDRYQEIIPQREKDRMNVLKNKMKAIETFRKTKLDKRGPRKRKCILPKPNAELSESSDSD